MEVSKMTMEELLKSLGLEKEKIAEITDKMKENKIYTVGEENLDIRYGRLKEQSEDTKTQLTQAQTLIEQLKKGNPETEELQSKIAEYENKIAELQEDIKTRDTRHAIEKGLRSAGAKEDDFDYLIFKLNEASKDPISVDDKGDVPGLADKLTELKTKFPQNFSSGDDKILENKLPENKEMDELAGIESAFSEALGLTTDQNK